MNDADRVRELLDLLRARIDSHGLVVDDELRSQILRAHVDAGMSRDAIIHIVLGPPASDDEIRHLNDCVKTRLGRELPADYVAFLRQHNGMMVGELTQDESERMAGDPQSFSDHALLSTVLVQEWMESAVVDVTEPDGTKSRGFLPYLPFYSMVETGCHAFDLSARNSGERIYIVDVDGEKLWQQGGHDVMAQSFVDWLDAFIRAGFEPFATKALLALR